MSIGELIKMIGDTIARFVTWKGSGLLILAIMAIPLCMCACKAVINIYVRYFYEDSEEKKDKF